MKIDFSELSKKPEFNTLINALVYDNSCGNASALDNKTSIWCVCGEKIFRICNIATTNVDGVDNVGLYGRAYEVKGNLYDPSLPRILCEVDPGKTVLFMNPLTLHNLSCAALVMVVKDKYFFMGAECRADNSIKNDEKTVY